jgi:hypothetical protein
MGANMDIAQACQIIRRCNEALHSYSIPRECADVPLAVSTLKHYLELAREDGKPIDELLISESVLLTPQGMRWVMSFVAAAETLEGRKSGTPAP